MEDKFNSYVAEVECPPYEFYIERYGDALCLRARLWRVDTLTGEFGWGHGGRYLLTPDMSKDDVVKRCFMAARDYAEHEVREAFRYRGHRVFGPHTILDDLWMITHG